MGIKCGIVGLPNVGKSTLFNALTKAGIAAANFPFCTIEPNTGVVPVPDPRLRGHRDHIELEGDDPDERRIFGHLQLLPQGPVILIRKPRHLDSVRNDEDPVCPIAIRHEPVLDRGGVHALTGGVQVVHIALSLVHGT